MEAPRVIIADDHPIFLEGLQALFKCTDEYELIGTATDGIAALDIIRRLAPDIAILDLSMPGLTGLQILEAVASERLRTKIVFLTASLTDEAIVAATKRRTWGIVLKSAAARTLFQCLRSVVCGDRWHSPEVVKLVSQELPQGHHNADKFELLTSREKEVAVLVAEGMSNKQIAHHINVSEGTVKIHLYNAYQKLEVSNRTSLAALTHTYLAYHRRLLT